jgi:hypothetical protein
MSIPIVSKNPELTGAVVIEIGAPPGSDAQLEPAGVSGNTRVRAAA